MKVVQFSLRGLGKRVDVAKTTASLVESEKLWQIACKLYQTSLLMRDVELQTYSLAQLSNNLSPKVGWHISWVRAEGFRGSVFFFFFVFVSVTLSLKP